MKKIRMIKENDMFGWRKGDVLEVDDDGKVIIWAVTNHPMLLDALALLTLEYAEWVEDEKIKDYMITEEEIEEQIKRGKQVRQYKDGEMRWVTIEDKPEKMEWVDPKEYRTPYDLIHKINSIVDVLNKLLEEKG